MSGGWRTLRVARRVPETESIVSLHLEAADGTELAAFQPGQFLTFRLQDAAGRAVPRNYSISSDPADLSHYRITVLRHPGGLGSGHMHDAMPEGATVDATEPKGRFVVDAASRRPVILLAGGIGITPLAAMAHALARGGRRTHLIHAVRDMTAQPFPAELQALTARSPTFHLTTAPTRAQGQITVKTLQDLLPIGDYEAYLCGPPAFMQAMFDLLVDLGVRSERIAYEFFGPTRQLTRSSAHEPDAAPEPPERIDVETTADAASPLVTFASSGRTARWDGTQRTLLDFAEAQGLTPAFSCRNGICNTCLVGIEGKVRYVEEPLEEPGPGEALLCCAVPDGPLVIRI